MRRVSTWYLLAGVGAAGVGLLAGPSSTFASVSWTVSGFAALGAIVYGLRRFRPARPLAWRLLAATFGFWGVAGAVIALAGVTDSSTVYRLGDLLYVLGYATVALATLVLVHRMGPLRVGLEAAVGTLALSSFLWPLVVDPSLDAGGLKGVAGAIFPVFDIALLMLLLRVVVSPLRGLRSLQLLASGALLLVTADVLYFSPVIANGVAAGRAIDALYTIAYFTLGAAALHASMRRLPPRRAVVEDVAPRRLLVVLGCAPLATPVAVLFSQLLLSKAEMLPLAGIGGATVFLVIVRLADLLRHLNALRLRAEESEQRFRMIFASAAHGMSIGSNGMLTETNPALQEMLGYTGAELSELHYTAITHPDDRLLAAESSDEVMVGERPSLTFEKRLVRRNGTSFWASVTLSRAHDGSFGISLIHDITVRKELEEELRQAQKMEAIGKLAGGIAHDFNNVMTAVSASADLLLTELAADDPRHERAQVIAQSAARATELTRQLLAFSRRQMLRLEAVDLSTIVAGMETMLAHLLPPNICVRYELAAGAFARVDKQQLEQVLLNLALNARDAMPGGGRLTISVRPSGESAELAVADDGIGMDAETRSRIFEPFFTTKLSGTGLGLSTVDGIVAQSGGTLAVESEPGAGTTFTIRLPRVDEAPAAPDPVTEAPPEGAPGRVLLADDEDLVRLVTSEMLRRLGYDVVAAASGEEALDLLDESFDVLVSDVAMTGMDGSTLARRAREQSPDLPVLFVSGYPAEVLEIGEGDEVLTKPFTPAELAERIELVRRRAPAQLQPA